jgi:hypothetical protein
VSKNRKAIAITSAAILVFANPVKRASFERIYFLAFVAARAMNPLGPSHVGKKLLADFLGRELSIKGINCFHTHKVTQNGAGVNTHLIAQTFIVTATFGITAVLTATSEKGELQFVSLPFVAAMALAVLAIILGVIGRSSGGIILTNPGNLHEKFLHRGEWTFKKDMIYFAGEHFKKNKDVVEQKHTLTTAMTWLFLGEMALLLFWVIFAKSVK